MTRACPALAERPPDIASPDYRDLHIRLLFRFPEPLMGPETRWAKSAALLNAAHHEYSAAQ